MTDQQLTRRMQQGDRQAFADFVDRYGGQVHRLARRYARSEADAEDVTQEVFIDLYKGIYNFRGEAKLSTWVYRIALNHCLKHRGRRQMESVPIDDLPLAAGDEHDPQHCAVRSDLTNVVEGALGMLSDLHREVVVLHEMHGMTYQECADILGVPVGTVKSRLFNAFARLRDRLGSYVRGEEEPLTAAAGRNSASPSAPPALYEAVPRDATVALKESR